jgi:hypothetical protein
MATIKRKLKVRQGTAATRPTLASGEIGFDTDTYGVWIGDGTTNRPMGIPVKKYVALLTQSSTSVPSATVLENTLGGTLAWTRGGQGEYTGTLSGAFTSNKTIIFTALNALASGATDPAVAYGLYSSANAVSLYVRDLSGNGIDGWSMNISISVYP